MQVDYKDNKKGYVQGFAQVDHNVRLSTPQSKFDFNDAVVTDVADCALASDKFVQPSGLQGAVVPQSVDGSMPNQTMICDTTVFKYRARFGSKGSICSSPMSLVAVSMAQIELLGYGRGDRSLGTTVQHTLPVNLSDCL